MSNKQYVMFHFDSFILGFLVHYLVFSLVDAISITIHFHFIDSFSSSLQHECSDGDNVFLKRKHRIKACFTCTHYVLPIPMPGE